MSDAIDFLKFMAPIVGAILALCIALAWIGDCTGCTRQTWIYDCAKRRPLQDCKHDYGEMFPQ